MFEVIQMNNPLTVMKQTKHPIRDYFENRKMQKEWDKYKAINEKLSTLSDFDNVLVMDAFKTEITDKIEKNSNGIMFMLDGDNLKQIINEYGNDRTDTMLLQMTKQIRQVLKEKEIKNYSIAKMGDEYYILVSLQNETEEEKKILAKEIIKNFNKQTAFILTMSSGYTCDLTKGAETSMKIAEKDMKKNKEEKKIGNFNKYHRDNAEETIKQWVNEIICSLRLDIKTLSKIQKEQLEKNIRDSVKGSLKQQLQNNVEPIHMQDIIRKMQQKGKNEESQGVVFKRLQQLKRQVPEELQNKYHIEIPEELVKDKINAELLMTLPIDGIQVEKARYFKEIGSHKFEAKTPQKTIDKMKELSVVYIDIGKIKEMNKLRGYNGCDEYALELIQKINSIAIDCELPLKNNIIVKGISELTLLLSSNTKEENIRQFYTKLKALEMQSELSINCSEAIPLIQEEETLKAIFSTLSPSKTFNTILNYAQQNRKGTVEEISSVKKTEDKDLINGLVVEKMEQITDSPVIRDYIRSKLKEGQSEESAMLNLVEKSVAMALYTDEQNRLPEKVLPQEVRETKEDFHK